jgi:hypothetical protein
MLLFRPPLDRERRRGALGGCRGILTRERRLQPAVGYVRQSPPTPPLRRAGPWAGAANLQLQQSIHKPARRLYGRAARGLWAMRGAQGPAGVGVPSPPRREANVEHFPLLFVRRDMIGRFGRLQGGRNGSPPDALPEARDRGFTRRSPGPWPWRSVIEVSLQLTV